MSILIASVWNTAPDTLHISSSLSSTSGALIYSFIRAIYFLLAQLLCVRGGALGIRQCGITDVDVLWHCMCGCGGWRLEKEQRCLLRSLPAFSHFLHYPQANWGLLVLVPRWVGLCTFSDLVDLSSELSCEAGSFSHCCIPHRFLPPGFETLFYHTGTLGCMVCLAPQLFFPVICMQMWDWMVHQLPPCLFRSSSFCLTACPLHPSYLSLPLLPVCVNVSSLTPWLSDFHVVRVSVSSGYFLFLNFVVLLVVQGGKVCLPIRKEFLRVQDSIDTVLGKNRRRWKQYGFDSQGDNICLGA